MAELVTGNIVPSLDFEGKVSDAAEAPLLMVSIKKHQHRLLKKFLKP